MYAQEARSERLPGELLQREPIHEAVPASGAAPIRLEALAIALCAWNLLALPLMFGGVSPIGHALTLILTFCALPALLFANLERIKALLEARSSSRLILACLAAFTAIAAVELAVLRLSPFSALLGWPHPLLPYADAILNPASSLRGAREICSFAALFAIARLALEGSAFRRITRWLLLASGALVCSVCLLHWLHDDGKLFWVFSADFSEASPRARWPFVNPNHLADYLLPIFFVYLLSASEAAAKLKEMLSAQRIASYRDLAHALQSRRAQAWGSELLAVALGGLAVLLCIAASLSRSAWIGLALALTLWLVAPALPAGAAVARDEQAQRPLRRGSRRRRRALPPIGWWRAGRWLAWLALGALTLFLLSGGGAELIKGRVEYGLAHSREDARWLLYTGTLEMLDGRWLLGVGLGNWAEIFPRYMAPELAGLEPYYLHSEPLQVLAETGILGAFPLAVLTTVLGVRCLSAVLERSERSLEVLALSCGLLALLCASIFEFPFRIPAIASCVAIVLAMLSVRLDQGSQSRTQQADSRG